jgi:signal transduction histidine kinase
MKAPLHILHLEDDANDAALIQATLAGGGIGCTIKRVETSADFWAELERGGVDLVISDYLLPHFDGLSALKMVRVKWPDLPFILVSGTLGEEQAIESLQSGATDYVLKDRLLRLVTAVRRALAESARHTERRRAEAELRWKTALLEAQLNADIDGVLVVDAQGRKLLQNRRMAELWRLPPEIAAHPDNEVELQFVTPQVREPDRFLAKIQHLSAHPEEVSRDEIERVDGSVLDRYSSPVLGPAGEYYGRIWTFRDITDQKKLEAQFRQAQKMEAVGRLAAGVAHDFNNLLTIILVNCGLLQEEALPGDFLKDSLTEIKEAGERAANLTRQLLAFSRQQLLEPRELNLNETVTDCARMLRRLVGEDIHLELVLDQGVKRVRADPGQLEQALMNLVVNARDAIPQFGKITLQTGTVVLEENQVRLHPQARPGGYVTLSVTDTGSGMDEATLARIFEPFFTTKEPGKGTGLGLAMVFGFIQQSGGHITVISRPGAGSTFTIHLPALAPGEVSPTPSEPPPEPAGGTETILLVEDEAGVRMLTRHVLTARGYKVLEAARGDEAIQLAKAHTGKMHLLITDMVMPVMGGGQLAEEIRALFPGIKVMLMSGYTGDALTRHGGLTLDACFLRKPFSVRALVLKVRALLDE